MKLPVNQQVYIRPFQRSDAENFVDAVHESFQTVGFWMPWCHAEYSLTEAESWIALCQSNIISGEAYDLGLFSSDRDELIGGIAINQINQRDNMGSIGYWVRQSRQRQGIATQATKMIATFGFEALKLTRLEIVIIEDNVASRRVAEKSGAIFECIARNRALLRGKPYDAAIYSLIPQNDDLA